MAICDVWVIGDTFLREALPVLQSIKTQAVENHTIKPFLYEYYNLIPLFASSNSYTKSFIAKTFNKLVAKMNNRTMLPKYMIIALDKDIIENLKQDDFGIQNLMHDAVHWLARNFEISLDLRRADIKEKNPGALWSSAEPRLVWVKMITRPMIKNRGHIFSHCKKFNDIIEDLIHTYKHTHVLPVEFPDNKKLFERSGNLTNKGRVMFWREVNIQMRVFDGNKTNLRPDEDNKKNKDDEFSASNNHQKRSQKSTSRDERSTEHKGSYKGGDRGDGASSIFKWLNQAIQTSC